MSKINAGLTLCPECHNYPRLSFKKYNPKDVLLQCDFCENKSYISIHNYLNKMKNSSYKIKDSNNCFHLQEYIYYCIEYKLYLCNECNLYYHQTHK